LVVQHKASPQLFRFGDTRAHPSDGCIKSIITGDGNSLKVTTFNQDLTRTEVRGQRSEDRGQRSEDRGQRTEVRGQKADNRWQRPEDRRWEGEKVRRLEEFEFGSGNAEFGKKQRLEGGRNPNSEVGMRNSEKNKGLEIESGIGKTESRNPQPETSDK
jgi:hypothetical protein